MSIIQAEPITPYETWGKFSGELTIDRLVLDAQKNKGIQPALPCSDAVFLRRVYVDLTGTLPKPDESIAFFRNKRPEKRARLIDRLLESEEYTHYWTLKWCDLLRVKA
jgi:hypothetical protein